MSSFDRKIPLSTKYDLITIIKNFDFTIYHLDLENTLVVEIQKGILLYSCHIVRKFLNIDTEHKTQKSQNAEARRR
jgi:hypothetical protein